MPEIAKNIEYLAADCNMQDSIMRLGQLSKEELRNWYATSQLVVLPSSNEGLGRVILEAQAMNVPVITYDVGGLSEAIRDGKTGYLVKKGDVKGLAKKIETLLADEHKRKAMGEAGRRFMESDFGIQQLLRRHEIFYLRMMRPLQSR